MKLQVLLILCCSLFILQCKNKKESLTSNVTCVSAMKNVMWKGELEGKIALDTIKNKEGLYGLGPAAYLKGELLINNGKSYLSTVVSDTTMQVKETFQVKAPFFVYGTVTNWEESSLPKSITNISKLEHLLQEKAKQLPNPFIFKLKGKVKSASIHIQNLPKGSIVRSPKEAHAGQTNYHLNEEWVEIIGFYSNQHKGVFTHHDTNIHMHLITTNATKMGHLDAVNFSDSITLFVPKHKME